MNTKHPFFKIASSCLLITCTATRLYTCQNKLTLFPNQSKKIVVLPFQYKHLSNEERKNIVIIPEYHFTSLSKDSQKTVAIGPLQPCKLVALKNTQTGTAVFFHLHDSNSIKKLCEHAQAKLKIQNSKDITGLIFTNACDPRFEWIFPKAYTGQKQSEKVKAIKDCIVSFFKIADRKQIAAKIYHSPYQDYELGEYEYAELGVFFNTEFKPMSICFMHENIFNKTTFNELHIEERRRKTQDAMGNYKKAEIKSKFTSPFTHYNHDDFIELA